jgi:hypothetical protein
MKRPSYKAAIWWLAANDDCDWLEDKEAGSLSVSASLVADMFGVEDERVTRDLRVEVIKQRGARMARMMQG